MPEEGFPISEIIARSWNGSVKALSEWPDSTKTYLPADGSRNREKSSKIRTLPRVTDSIACQPVQPFIEAGHSLRALTQTVPARGQ